VPVATVIAAQQLTGEVLLFASRAYRASND
jgi:hypothetical protein